MSETTPAKPLFGARFGYLVVLLGLFVALVRVVPSRPPATASEPAPVTTAAPAFTHPEQIEAFLAATEPPELTRDQLLRHLQRHMDTAAISAESVVVEPGEAETVVTLRCKRVEFPNVLRFLNRVEREASIPATVDRLVLTRVKPYRDEDGQEIHPVSMKLRLTLPRPSKRSNASLQARWERRLRLLERVRLCCPALERFAQLTDDHYRAWLSELSYRREEGFVLNLAGGGGSLDGITNLVRALRTDPFLNNRFSLVDEEGVYRVLDLPKGLTARQELDTRIRLAPRTAPRLPTVPPVPVESEAGPIRQALRRAVAAQDWQAAGMLAHALEPPRALRSTLLLLRARRLLALRQPALAHGVAIRAFESESASVEKDAEAVYLLARIDLARGRWDAAREKLPEVAMLGRPGLLRELVGGAFDRLRGLDPQLLARVHDASRWHSVAVSGLRNPFRYGIREIDPYDVDYSPTHGRGGRPRARPIVTGASVWRPSPLRAHTSRLYTRGSKQPPLLGLRAKVRVDGFRARVVLDHYYLQPRITWGRRRREGLFQVRLPDRASPYLLAFGETRFRGAGAEERQRYRERLKAETLPATPEVIDTYEPPKPARMVERKLAARAYFGTVVRRVDPALLEWAGGGIFNARVFPLVSGKLHRIQLGYDLDLTPSGDALELKLRLPKEAKRTWVELDLPTTARVTPNADGRPAEGRSRYALENPGDVVTIRVPKAAGAAAITGTDPGPGRCSAAAVRLDLPGGRGTRGAERAVFLLDTSLSAQPKRFAVWLDLVGAILKRSRATLKAFAVLFFNVEQRWWRPTFVPNTPENVAALRTFAQTLALEGATDLHSALRSALRFQATVGGETPRDLFLLSDGFHTWGRDPVEYAGQLDAHRLFAYRLQLADTVPERVRLLCERSGGAVFTLLDNRVETAATAHWTRPWRLKRVEAPGLSDLLVAGRPSAVYHGQRLVLAGRGRLKGPVRVHLERDGVKHAATIRVPNATTSPMAARVYGELATGQLEQLVEVPAETALAYARHFRVPSPRCSMLMLESQADYDRWKVTVKNDAPTVRDRRVAELIAAREAKRWARISDPKAMLLADLRRIGAPLPPTLHKALAALPAEAFALEGFPTECRKGTWKGVDPSYVKALDPKNASSLDLAAVLSEARTRKRRLGALDGLKALSSAVELDPGLRGVREAAEAAGRWGLHERAAQVLQNGAVRLKRAPLWLHLALARALNAARKPALALAWYELSLVRAHERLAQRRAVAREYLGFLSALEGPLTGYARRRGVALKRTLELGDRLDLVVTVRWEAPVDIDLNVIDPTGALAGPGEATGLGGRIGPDMQGVDGVETYTLARAQPGTYRFLARWVPRHKHSRVEVQVYRGWGTPAMKTERWSLWVTKRNQELGTVEVP